MKRKKERIEEFGRLAGTLDILGFLEETATREDKVGIPGFVRDGRT